MSRSGLRDLFRLVILLFITTTLSASSRDADRTPGLSVERGEMRGFDKDSQAVVLRTATGDESFRLTSATILREGDHVIQPGDLWRFVGHSAKARVQRSKGQQVLTNMIISPEHVTHGRLVSYDPRSRGLVVDANVVVAAAAATPRGAAARQRLAGWSADAEDLHVPNLFVYEVANALSGLEVAELLLARRLQAGRFAAAGGANPA